MTAAAKFVVCHGNEYKACRTHNTFGMFRWRDVACSLECGAIYLADIEKSRSKDKPKEKSKRKENNVKVVETPATEDEITVSTSEVEEPQHD